MVLYGLTMFLSAFLLFLVQPLIGKYILPWFGGTPAVWTTCMLFFQAVLLLGYSYAHALASRWPLRRQAIAHFCLLAVTTLSLPIIPSPGWKPADGLPPIPRILGLLLFTIGAPYFLLSSTSPLLQSWFSKTRPGKSPYRLYALSNLGSLLAILSYPFLFEPSLSLDRQASIWSWAYAAFALLCVVQAFRLIRIPQEELSTPVPGLAEISLEEVRPGFGKRLLWLSLTACSCFMLLATTNQMCEDVAVIPLLWIVPLALYLITFILCFQYEKLYWRPFFIPALAGAIAWTCYVLFGNVYVPLKSQIISYSLTLFLACMVCHGELVRLKPGPRHLTNFYLTVAGGGVIGGILVTIAAPYFFKDFWEYHLGLFMTAVLTLVALFRDSKGAMYRGKPLWAWTVLYLSVAALVFFLARHVSLSLEHTVQTARNFFGVLRVLELNKDNPDEHRLTLMHGRIEHGFQYLDKEKRYWPTSYYGPDSGIGLAITLHPRRAERGSPRGTLRIGVVGLGTGTIAAYGMQGDYIRFYEINPEVLRLSDQYFSYRKDSAAKIDVVLGDARVSMERERQHGESQQFDVLAVDAFSSDAIPVHLLTRECLQTYLYHLKPDGILAVHISNRYFDLSPVVRNMALPDPEHGMQALWIDAVGNESQGTDATDWILLTSNEEFVADPDVKKSVKAWDDTMRRIPPWTDNHTDLFNLLRH